MRHEPTLGMTHLGFIPGELSFAANSGELERTRANSGELRANSPAVRRHPHSGELRRTFAGVRRTFAGVRSGSPEFARTPPRTGERFARKFVRRKKSQPAFAANEVRRERGSPRTWFAANVVRRERGSSRTTFAANDNFGELVRQKLLENADYSSLSRTSSPPPRTTVRRELQFAAN